MQALQQVVHLLPYTVRQIAELIGLPLTLRLIEQRGGTTFTISKCQRSDGFAKYEELAEIIGYAAADKMAARFGGDRLTIPLCLSAVREVRDRAIRNDFDRLTETCSSTHVVHQLARQHHMTERNVWLILKRIDSEPDERQGSLF